MSKFHINKHGVPAPCKAKQGNCPLGGEDTHFKSKEEAQAFVDKQSANVHGLLPSSESASSIVSAQISQDSFEWAFQEPYDGGGGWLITGISNFEFQAMGIDEDSVNRMLITDGMTRDDADYTVALLDVYKALPENLRKELNRTDLGVILVKEDDIAKHIFESLNEELLDNEFEEVHDYVAEHSPESIDDYDDLSEEFKEKVGEFTAKRLKKEAPLEMNGKKIYVDYGVDKERLGFVKDYIASLK